MFFYFFTVFFNYSSYCIDVLDELKNEILVELDGGDITAYEFLDDKFNLFTF